MEMQNIKGKSAEDRVSFNLLKLRKKEEKLNPQPSGTASVKCTSRIIFETMFSRRLAFEGEG